MSAWTWIETIQNKEILDPRVSVDRKKAEKSSQLQNGLPFYGKRSSTQWWNQESSGKTQSTEIIPLSSTELSSRRWLYVPCWLSEL